MSKYVLLQFDDDADADAVIKYADQGLILSADGGLQHHTPLVRGVWRKPTKFCECRGDKKNRGFRRGQKYGWWVHSKCGKPSQGWGRGDHWFLALGKNLLPKSTTAPEYRGDGQFALAHNVHDVCGTKLETEVGLGTTVVWCPKCEVHV